MTTTVRKSRTLGSRRVRSVTTISVFSWPIERLAAPKAEVNEANISSLTGPPAAIWDERLLDHVDAFYEVTLHLRCGFEDDAVEGRDHRERVVVQPRGADVVVSVNLP